MYSFSFWWGNFFSQKDFFPLFVLVVRARFSSLDNTFLLWILPYSCRKSSHIISKFGCTYWPFIVEKNVSHEYGRSSTTICKRLSSSTMTPILKSRSLEKSLWRSKQNFCPSPSLDCNVCYSRLSFFEICMVNSLWFLVWNILIYIWDFSFIMSLLASTLFLVCII